MIKKCSILENSCLIFDWAKFFHHFWVRCIILIWQVGVKKGSYIRQIIGTWWANNRAVQTPLKAVFSVLLLSRARCRIPIFLWRRLKGIAMLYLCRRAAWATSHSPVQLPRALWQRICLKIKITQVISHLTRVFSHLTWVFSLLTWVFSPIERYKIHWEL